MKLTPPLAVLTTALALTALPARGQHSILTIEGPGPNAWLGAWVEGLGDVNGDGTEDFAAMRADPVLGGFADIRSGGDGAVLFTIPAPLIVDFGSVRSAGDVDGNGVPDVITGFFDFATLNSRVQVYDGSGALLHDITGPPVGPVLLHVNVTARETSMATGTMTSCSVLSR